jgi:hypothetical protein
MPGQNRTPKNAWRETFLAVLRDTANVRIAATRGGIARSAAYEARERDADFRAKWDEALEDAVDVLEAEARRRAVTGCRKQIYYKGEAIGEEVEYSDTLLIFLLKAHRPDKFRETQVHRHEGKDGGAIQHQIDVTRLTDDELASAETHIAALEALAASAAQSSGDPGGA